MAGSQIRPGIALQLDSAKRSAYLDQACSSDPSLRQEVESLLAAGQQAYEDYLTLWKEADPDIPIYKQVKAEYVKLH